VQEAGGTASLSADGSFSDRPDVAIVVFGEEPYAEFVGDRATLEYSPGDKTALETLRRLKAAGIPTVSIFLSGRPLWVNPELNASDAFVAAFLPGSEGGGIADVIFRDDAGRVLHDFKGKLSYSWPKRADQSPLNRGEKNYDPLFAYGFGRSYGDRSELAALPEDRPPPIPGGADGVYFGRGSMPIGWRWSFEGGKVSRLDRRGQEDTVRFAWPGGSAVTARIESPKPIDISREATGELSLLVDYRLDEPPASPVTLALNGASLPIGGLLRAAPIGEWKTMTLPLRCFVRAGLDPKNLSVPMAITTSGKLTMSISDVRLASTMVDQNSCGQP